MATTYLVSDFDNAVFLGRTTTMPIINNLKFADGVTAINAQGGEDTVYRFIGGSNPALPASLRIGNYPPTKPGQSLNSSAKLRVSCLKTDGDGVESILPVEVVVAINDGTLGMLGRAAMANLVFYTVSSLVVATSHTAPSLDMTQLNALVRGATDILPLIPDPDNV